MRAVKLDEVEAGSLHAPRGIDEGLCRPLDAGLGHLRRHNRLGLHLIDGGGNRRRSDGRLAGDGLAGATAVVAELDGDTGTESCKAPTNRSSPGRNLSS